MNILEKAKKHFDDIGIIKIEVPEWDDVIYSEPCTLAEKGETLKRMEASNIDGVLYIIMRKAQDASGNKLFTLEDKQTLKVKVDPDILIRIANKILKTPTVDEMGL